VSRFIALTEFARAKLIAAGLPADKIRIKPNFVQDPMNGGVPSAGSGHHALYVGRLSVEKGVKTLLAAWADIGIPLRIVGDGPLRDELERAAPPNVTFLGHQDRADVFREIAGAMFLLVPSIWYEGFPMTVVEAMAMGKPIIASAIGGLQEIVTDGQEGLHFRAGSEADLQRAVQQILTSPMALEEMGSRARIRYLNGLSPSSNAQVLNDIYTEMVA
jgi:glycosyltransferase involved in cell wall biosynthesis